MGKNLLFSSLVFLALAAAVCCSSSSDKAKTPSKPGPKPDTVSEVSLIFAGDIMMHLPEVEAAQVDSTGGYDFTPFFRYVSPLLKKSDLAIANLETTFGGKPYKGYPQFSSPDTLGWFCKNSGFNLLMTANNHSDDRGTKGILGTINGLEKAGMPHTGTFRDSAERANKYPLMIEKNGLKLAFLNYTFSTNGLIVHPPVIVNYIDTAQIKIDIAAAKAKKADAIIVMFHWGVEYQRLPNEEQRRIAKFCLANGIDVVIGAHPHVVQPAYWETFRKPGDTADRKGLVLYSLGNFVSAQRQKYTDGGIMFSFKLRKNKLKNTLTVADPQFVPTWVYISSFPQGYSILPASTFQHDSTLLKAPGTRVQMLQSFKENREHMLHDTLPWLKEIRQP